MVGPGWRASPLGAGSKNAEGPPRSQTDPGIQGPYGVAAVSARRRPEDRQRMIGWERDLEGGTGDATPVALFSTDSHSRRRRARLVSH